MRVLVTGGLGFIGSHIAQYFVAQGHDVVVTGKTGTNTLEKSIHVQSIQELATFGTFDAVFHQAALTDTTVLDKERMFHENVVRSRKLFDILLEKGCKHIVYASSATVYGNGSVPYKEHQQLQPLNPYAESKLALEKLAQTYRQLYPDVTFVGLRYSNVYGPGEAHKGTSASIIYQFAQCMLKGNPTLFNQGQQQRDYIYVADVVRANALAAQAKESCVVNCGSGKPTTSNELVAILNDVLGLKRIPEYVGNPYQNRSQSHTACDMTLAKEKLGFVPEHDIRKGIQAYHASGALTRTTNNI